MTKKGNKIFLATTALEDFWKSSKDIFFLGSWCRVYSKKANWEHLPEQVIVSPWRCYDDVSLSFRYLDSLYEELLPELSSVLNEMHGEEHSIRFWRITVGPWLQWYLHVLYDRYLHIIDAVKQLGSFETILLSESSYIVPVDTLDFSYLSREDAYNLQIYSSILRAMGLSYPEKVKDLYKNHLPHSTPKRSVLQKAKSRIWSAVKPVVSLLCNGSTIIVKDAQFFKKDLLQLFLKSGGKIGACMMDNLTLSRVKNDVVLRRKIKEALVVDNGGFESVARELISLNIPQSFVESVKSVIEKSCEYPVKSPKIILSANAWYFDECFKYWAAVHSEKGTKLLGMQHGTAYHIYEVSLSDRHEAMIEDIFYSWGYSKQEGNITIKPLPSPKLSAIPICRSNNHKEGILFVSTIVPRYTQELPFISSWFEEYLHWQQEYLGALSADLRKVVRFRPHYEDYGWDITQRLIDEFPGLCVEDWSTPFVQSLVNCRLYVCDHLSTTFGEALVANKPTILFWNKEHFKFNHRAGKCFQNLCDVGIVYESSEDAARATADVYDDIDGWWHQDHRQKARRDFCEEFVMSSTSLVSEWLAELLGTDA